jgi:hypothetical protein
MENRMPPDEPAVDWNSDGLSDGTEGAWRQTPVTVDVNERSSSTSNLE